MCQTHPELSSKCRGQIQCANNLLCQLEAQIKVESASSEIVSSDTLEMVQRFFEQVLSAKCCLVVRNPLDVEITTIAQIIGDDRACNFGFNEYLPCVCKYIEKNFIKVLMSATQWQAFDSTMMNPSNPDTSINPTPVEFYLNDLISHPDASFNGTVMYGNGAGIDTNSNLPAGISDGQTYVVIDKDELLSGICQLKNHF